MACSIGDRALQRWRFSDAAQESQVTSRKSEVFQTGANQRAPGPKARLGLETRDLRLSLTTYQHIVIHSCMSDPAFKALSDPTRREILRLLGERDLTAGEIGARFPVSQPAVS